jgi:hypothetical protein
VVRNDPWVPSPVPDAVGVRFAGGPLDGQQQELPRWFLNEEIRLPADRADPVDSRVTYHRAENLVHWDDSGVWVRYDFGPLAEAEPAVVSDHPDYRPE